MLIQFYFSCSSFMMLDTAFGFRRCSLWHNYDMIRAGPEILGAWNKMKYGGLCVHKSLLQRTKKIARVQKKKQRNTLFQKRFLALWIFILFNLLGYCIHVYFGPFKWTRGRAPRKRGVICVCCCCSVLLSVSVLSYVVLTLVLVRAIIWQSRGSEVVELVGRQLFVVDYV